MIHYVGQHAFHEAYVTFHFARDNAYSPWESIGVALVYQDFADAKYLPEYAHLRREFKDEVAEANGLAGTYEFMDLWHRRHQETNDVVSKVIRYCTTWHDMWGVLQKLKIDYVGTFDAKQFAKMAIMLKSRERYFPVVFQRHSQDGNEVLLALREAGLIT